MELCGRLSRSTDSTPIASPRPIDSWRARKRPHASDAASATMPAGHGAIVSAHAVCRAMRQPTTPPHQRRPGAPSRSSSARTCLATLVAEIFASFAAAAKPPSSTARTNTAMLVSRSTIKNPWLRKIERYTPFPGRRTGRRLPL